jgi:hypothetical protein
MSETKRTKIIREKKLEIKRKYTWRKTKQIHRKNK